MYSATSDLHAKEMDTVLGNLWHILNPLLQIAVYFFVFGVVLETDRGVDNFLTFVAIGVFGYGFMRQAVIGGSRSIIGNQGLMRSLDFPRALLPVSATAAEVVAFMPPVLVMLLIALITGETPTLRWLMIIPVFALQTAFTLGMALLAARTTFHFRDFDNILVFLFRMAFYFSGVLFLVDKYVTDPFIRQLADLNPLLDYLSLYRWAIMDLPVSRLLVISGIAWGVLSLPLGYLWFRVRESEYVT